MIGWLRDLLAAPCPICGRPMWPWSTLARDAGRWAHYECVRYPVE